MAGNDKLAGDAAFKATTTTVTGKRYTETLVVYTTILGGGNGATASASETTITSTVVKSKGSSATNSKRPNSRNPSASATSSSPTTSPTYLGGTSLVSTPSTSPTTTSSTSASAASAATSSSASFTSSSHSNGFTSGDIAGAAVGCLFGGFLIAFLLAFLLFRRKRKSDQAPPAGAAAMYGGSEDRRYAGEKSIATSDSSTSSWLAFLPQSADDRTIENAVKTFYNQIELHVDNFYHRNGVDFDVQTREALAQTDSGKLPGRMEDLMQDQRMVIPAIKHSIADLLITRLSPLTFPETSLLPAHLAEFPPKLQTSSKAPGENAAAQQAYSQWRLLNAYLYPHPEEDQTYLEDREAKAHDIAEILAAAFSPWLSRTADDSAQRNQHERALVATAGNLGILLMSQPSAFEFKWSTSPGRSASGRPLIAFPGFWKTSDDHGRPLDHAQNLVQPVVLRV